MRPESDFEREADARRAAHELARLPKLSAAVDDAHAAHGRDARRVWLVIAALAIETLRTRLWLADAETLPPIRARVPPPFLGTLVGRRVVLATVGMGGAAATAATHALLDRLRDQDLEPAGALIVGFAGGLDPDLEPGDVVVLERVLDDGDDAAGPLDPTPALTETLDAARTAAGIPGALAPGLTTADLVDTPAAKRALREAATRIDADRTLAPATVDMETAAIGHALSAAQVPWGCARAVMDPAGVVLPPVLAPFGERAGLPLWLSVFWLLATRPWLLGTLMRLGAWQSRASRHLHRLLLTFLSQVREPAE